MYKVQIIGIDYITTRINVCNCTLINERSIFVMLAVVESQTHKLLHNIYCYN